MQNKCDINELLFSYTRPDKLLQEKVKEILTAFPICHLLPCERWHIGLQKHTFYNAKGMLLQVY